MNRDENPNVEKRLAGGGMRALIQFLIVTAATLSLSAAARAPTIWDDLEADVPAVLDDPCANNYFPSYGVNGPVVELTPQGLFVRDNEHPKARRRRVASRKRLARGKAETLKLSALTASLRRFQKRYPQIWRAPPTSEEPYPFVTIIAPEESDEDLLHAVRRVIRRERFTPARVVGINGEYRFHVDERDKIDVPAGPRPTSPRAVFMYSVLDGVGPTVRECFQQYVPKRHRRPSAVTLSFHVDEHGGISAARVLGKLPEAAAPEFSQCVEEQFNATRIPRTKAAKPVRVKRFQFRYRCRYP